MTNSTNKKNENPFETLYSDNGRITISEARLGSLSVLDTSLDLEIINITGAGEHLRILTDFYSPEKNVSALTYNGIISVKLGDITSNTRGTDEVKDIISYGAADNACGLKNNTYNTLALFLPADNSFCKARYGFSDLIRIIRQLTSENGCPWDKVQTHNSINTNMIEEAYEAAAAVIANDTEEMCEEFGDVMLQSVLNCDIAARAGEFTLNDCIDTLCKKLYSRHTHIFGKDNAADERDALRFWEKAKEKEKNYTGASARLDKLPHNLPALMFAQKTVKTIMKELPATQDEIIAETVRQLDRILDAGNLESGKLLLLLTVLYSLTGSDAETGLLRGTLTITEAFKKDIKTTSFLELLSKI